MKRKHLKNDSGLTHRSLVFLLLLDLALFVFFTIGFFRADEYPLLSPIINSSNNGTSLFMVFLIGTIATFLVCLVLLYFITHGYDEPG